MQEVTGQPEINPWTPYCNDIGQVAGVANLKITIN